MNLQVKFLWYVLLFFILYTVSETAVKVNNLDTLELVNELKIEDN